MSVFHSAPLADPNDMAPPETGADLWWLGQAGFLIAQGGLRIVIDAYLSDSLAQKYRGTAFPHQRMMPPPVEPGALREIDWLLCTHGHTDHMDPGTIPALLAENPRARVLAPRAERARALERGVPPERLVLIDAGETFDLGGVRCTATPSAHEDLRHTPEGYLYLGYVLTGGGIALWHSGDTIPFPGLAEWLMPFRLDLALLPVNGRDAQRAANGVPGNFTLSEAMAITDAIGARGLLGHHIDLFAFNTLVREEGQRQLEASRVRAHCALAAPGLRYRVEAVARAPLSVLVVCRGNICRSPTADGILRQAIPDHHIDSAAIMSWNVGRPPHPETAAVAAARGVQLGGIVGRQICLADFNNFDLILGMDDENMDRLYAMRPAGGHARLGRLGAYASLGVESCIIDPWGQERAVFEEVFDQIKTACDRLATFVRVADSRAT
ncbi:MBL fold metallo-hydrolase [Ensifer sp. YR511]|uniref:arsenate reductase/protein-tyrosine-phosphatase family protein n=1 Tax=Ensifer sp. YR511 TaxID=1855294 RepID=UPI00088AB152|nr:MBL fold metallo-hydrolase [Ensifer sp. YR511]SDN04291.1 Protein-tyrosine-phosphatase [Ensifer sp. YR511]